MDRRTIWGIVLAAAATLGLGADPAQAAAPQALFDTREVMASNLKPFPKWVNVIARQSPDQGRDNGPCQVRALNRCGLESWGQVLEAVKGMAPAEQLDAINRYMNRAPYVTDLQTYNVEDYWAIPPEFFDNDGDCEDYAIAKFLSLRALGWPNEDLRIVVLQDLNLQVPHAVLAAYVDGVPYILDNQVDSVVAASRIHHYLPLFSINETNWWLHKP